MKAAPARIAVTTIVAAIVITLSGELFGPKGWAAGAAAALLWIAWRHDNEVGVCLPLAVLFLIVVDVLCLLIYLIMLTHAH